MFNKDQPEFKLLRGIIAGNTSQLVIWMGSGISAPANIPTWRELKTILEKEAYAKSRTLDPSGRKRIRRKIRDSKATSDTWLAFDLLEEALGKQLFEDIVREKLTPSAEVSVPSGYRYIWSLNPRGVISLNIDGLAAKSFHLEKSNESLNELNGLDAGKRLNVLNSALRFVVNLHGIHGNRESWVFRKSELLRLVNDGKYRRFIETIFVSFRVLFLGITVDDVAVSSFLGNIKRQGISLGSHFWVTDRKDDETENWAQENGVNIIRFKSVNGDYSELEKFFEEMICFLPKEEVPPPVKPTDVPIMLELPNPDKIATERPEIIRQTLNAHAAKILKSGTEKAYMQYEKFRDKYSRAIHYADYAKPASKDDEIFGYKLIKLIGSGGFSAVFRAMKGEDEFAVKKFRSERVGIKGMLQCFRRGVKSMEILTKDSVYGVVPYKEAYEIPPCVVMELIDGPDLRDVCFSGKLSFIDKLKIACDVANILRNGHNLEQSVLHRDIRPGNIMLKNYKPNRRDFKVVVLDFDLSWHKEAFGQSVRPDDMNYHAPEQLMDIEGVSTRNALVDSFGFGMTLFYLFSGKDPDRNNYMRRDYREYLKEQLRRTDCGEYRSFSTRIARLIYNSTVYNQKARLKMGQIHAELQRIYNVCNEPGKYEYVDFLTDELLFRCLGKDGYVWDNNQLMGKISLVSGFDVCLTAHEVKRVTELDIHWISKGIIPPKNVGRLFAKKQDFIKQTLKKGGWKREDFFWSGNKLDAKYFIKLGSLSQNFNKVVEALKECIITLRFE